MKLFNAPILVKRPFFSIIVPVYNVAPYLRECLDSVLAQTFTDWECLCVDDGSTDESGAILDEYAQKDSRFRIFHQPNAGVSAARNRALNNVKGEWVGFLDGDDVYHLELMSKCERAIAQFASVEMVKFQFVEYNNLEVPNWTGGEESCDVKYVSCESSLKCTDFNGGMCTNLYKFRCIKGIKFPRLILGEDWVWKVKAIDKVSSYILLNQNLYGYRTRPGSAMNSELTLDKLMAELFWRNYVWRILKDSRKKISISCLRGFELSQTEGYSNVYFSRDKKTRKEIWANWLGVIDDIVKRGASTRWIHFSSYLVTLFKSVTLAYILFYVPYRLKVYGFHR